MQTIPKFLFATVLASAAYAIAQPVQAISFTSTPTIPITGSTLIDNSSTDFLFNVSGFTNGASGTYTFSLNLDVTHSALAELEGYLIAPVSGLTLNLFSTASGSDFTTTTFIDAGNSIASGTNPYTGNFQPQGNNGALGSTALQFSDFNGFTPNGTWTLRIFDTAPLNTGTLNSVSLDITDVTPPAPVPFEFDGSAGLAMIGGGFALRHYYKKRKESGK